MKKTITTITLALLLVLAVMPSAFAGVVYKSQIHVTSFGYDPDNVTWATDGNGKKYIETGYYHLGGVRFEVYNTSGEKVDEFTTDETGTGKSALLSKGVYYLREVEVPDGYEILQVDEEKCITLYEPSQYQEVFTFYTSTHSPIKEVEAEPESEAETGVQTVTEQTDTEQTDASDQDSTTAGALGQTDETAPDTGTDFDAKTEKAIHILQIVAIIAVTFFLEGVLWYFGKKTVSDIKQSRFDRKW